MNDEVERSEFLLGPIDDGRDLGVVGDIHRYEEFRVGLGIGDLGDAAAVSLAFVVGTVGQVGEADLPPLGHHFLGDRPGDRVVVGHAEHEPLESVESAHERSLLHR